MQGSCAQATGLTTVEDFSCYTAQLQDVDVLQAACSCSYFLCAKQLGLCSDGPAHENVVGMFKTGCSGETRLVLHVPSSS